MTHSNPSPGYRFTNDWFNSGIRACWSQLLAELKPSRALEIGCFEGASTCFLVESVGRHRSLELHCIDTWQGSLEHQMGRSAEADMVTVEARFEKNVQEAVARSPHPVNVHVHKGRSQQILPKLISQGGAGFFDLVYIDGSHQSADVLSDSVDAFRLTRNGGIMVFDDYLWRPADQEMNNPLYAPKLAIDSFVTIFGNKLTLISAPLNQIYVLKNLEA